MYLSIKYPDGNLVDKVEANNITDAICSHGHFLCANDKCLVASDMCDGIDDCGDNSDESTICSGHNHRLIITKK